LEGITMRHVLKLVAAIVLASLAADAAYARGPG
jgi:hypothetical protein